MKTIWKYSIETECLRLLHGAHQIGVGFYKINGFIPLPYSKSIASDNFVSFPELNYLSIPRFWEQVKHIDVSTLPIKASAKLVEQTAKLLSLANLTKPEFSKLQKEWDKHQEKILAEIFKLIPDKASQVSEIIIMPTAFGTGCSFNQHRKAGDPIIIWIRHDKGIAEIVEAIITSLTRADVFEKLGGLWQESEIIVDWLLTFSPLGKLLKEIGVDVKGTLTIKNTRSVQNATLLAESEKFMRKIGAPIVSVSQVDTSNFSDAEKELFELLKSKSPNVVTFDELSKTDPDNFSLYAVSKSIQRLRDKLEKSGVSGSYIQTKRGEGYLLIN